MSAATCETQVRSGLCGVMAVGRCIDCQQAFCPSHQGLNANGPYTNLCSSCLIDRLTQARDQAAADAERAVSRRSSVSRMRENRTYGLKGGGGNGPAQAPRP
jgi:hypothetical protein